MDSQRRNLNPTAPAYVAMTMYGKEYATQMGGSMDFWDNLTKQQQKLCYGIAEKIKAAPMVDDQ